MIIEFNDDELEMIQDLVFEHASQIGYSVFYGNDSVNREYKEIAQSILNKMKENDSKRCKK